MASARGLGFLTTQWLGSNSVLLKRAREDHIACSKLALEVTLLHFCPDSRGRDHRPCLSMTGMSVSPGKKSMGG